MYFMNLVLSDRNGERTVEYAFADEGKVLVDKDGNTVSGIERARVEEFTEVEPVDDEISDEEALEILLGEGSAT